MNYLGKYLKKKLKEMKVSEREISARCGISHSYLNQLIKGVNPSTKKNISPTLVTFEKLSNGLGVSVDFLQRVARGIVNNDDETYSFEKTLVADKLFKAENAISPDLIKQIHDFQNFMSVIGLDKSAKSEKEWAELIHEIKSVIQKHMQEKE